MQALRVDNGLPEQPGSAKMVSLDLLLGSNSTPATPRDPDLMLLPPVRRCHCWLLAPLLLPAQALHGPCA